MPIETYWMADSYILRFDYIGKLTAEEFHAAIAARFTEIHLLDHDVYIISDYSQVVSMVSQIFKMAMTHFKTPYPPNLKTVFIAGAPHTIQVMTNSINVLYDSHHICTSTIEEALALIKQDRETLKHDIDAHPV